MLTGAQIVIKCLEELGITAVFGYIGNSIMPIFNELSLSGIKLYTPSSEIGATHMADGYSRAGATTGVVLATSGPGATNIVTGLATAFMDSVPIVAITANVATQKLGKDSFQEIDTAGIMTPITKYSHIISSVEELEYQIKRAFIIAGSGRKGTVLIDIPCNILADLCEYNNVRLVMPSPKMPQQRLIDDAAQLINDSKNPLILVGGGALGATTAISALANMLGCPIATSLRAVGTINSPHYLGLIGSAAPQQNNMCFKDADIIIAIGTRFSDKLYTKINKNQKFIHIDIDSAELYKIINPYVAIHGDAEVTIKMLLPLIKSKAAEVFYAPTPAAPKPQSRGTETAIVQEHQSHGTATAIVQEQQFSTQPAASKMNNTRLLAKIINDCLTDEIIIATDVGTHQIAMLNAITNKSLKDIISSVGLGTMGFGLSASIGAHIASNKRVILATGDGSFNMSMNELITAIKLDIPLTVVIFNNHTLKMIKDIQTKKFGKNYIAIATPKINYARLARALGARGINATIKSAKDSIITAINSNKVTIINVNLR